MSVQRIADALQASNGTSAAQAKRDVQKVLAFIKDTTKQEGKLTIVGFGTFSFKKRAARKGRNPQTGESIDIPERVVFTFKGSHK